MNQLFRDKPPLKKQRGRPKSDTAPKRKAKIPAAVQEAIWITKMGRIFEGKCLTTWCPNIITVFDYHAGHDIPESKGGDISIENLYPICARCNLSMGDRYTLKQWSAMSPETTTPSVATIPSVVVVPQQKSWWCC